MEATLRSKKLYLKALIIQQIKNSNDGGGGAHGLGDVVGVDAGQTGACKEGVEDVARVEFGDEVVATSDHARGESGAIGFVALVGLELGVGIAENQRVGEVGGVGEVELAGGLVVAIERSKGGAGGSAEGGGSSVAGGHSAGGGAKIGTRGSEADHGDGTEQNDKKFFHVFIILW